MNIKIFFNNYFFAIIVRFVGPFLSIVLLSLSINILGINDASLFLEKIAYLNFAIAISLLGYQAIFTRETVKISKNIFTKIFLKKYMECAIVFLLLCVAGKLLLDFHQINYLYLFLMLSGLYCIFLTIFSASLISTGTVKIGLILQYSSLSSFAIFFLCFGIIGFFIILFITTVVIFYIAQDLKKILNGKNKNLYQKDKHYFFADNLVGSLQSNLPIFLLGSFGHESSVAIYSAYVKIVSVIPVFGSAINSIHTKRIALLFNDKAGLSKSYDEIKEISKKLFLVSFLPVFLVLCLGNYSFYLLGIDQSHFNFLLFMMLCLSQLFNLVCSPVSLSMNIAKKAHYKLYISCACLVFSAIYYIILYVISLINIHTVIFQIFFIVIIHNTLNYLFFDKFIKKVSK